MRSVGRMSQCEFASVAHLMTIVTFVVCATSQEPYACANEMLELGASRKNFPI
jgi:hypothetical protein